MNLKWGYIFSVRGWFRKKRKKPPPGGFLVGGLTPPPILREIQRQSASPSKGWGYSSLADYERFRIYLQYNLLFWKPLQNRCKSLRLTLFSSESSVRLDKDIGFAIMPVRWWAWYVLRAYPLNVSNMKDYAKQYLCRVHHYLKKQRDFCALKPQ